MPQNLSRRQPHPRLRYKRNWYSAVKGVGPAVAYPLTARKVGFPAGPEGEGNHDCKRAGQQKINGDTESSVSIDRKTMRRKAVDFGVGEAE